MHKCSGWFSALSSFRLHQHFVAVTRNVPTKGTEEEDEDCN